MSRWGNEIQTDVDPGVMIVKQGSFDLQLLLKIVFKLSVNVVNDGLVAVKRSKEKMSRFVEATPSKNSYLVVHS